ncbi:MAG: hypothetical protein CVU04_01890 [Bacteroidetes bacterium HGW-Bacteroidetes-20]|nr:MAG: hypothetical protein CVU04_01890 [Bacteroidetes bacterium HGW-Bacteroidetes-20]
MTTVNRLRTTDFHYSLFILHFSLFIIHFSLFIIHYSLFGRSPSLRSESGFSGVRYRSRAPFRWRSIPHRLRRPSNP